MLFYAILGLSPVIAAWLYQLAFREPVESSDKSRKRYLILICFFLFLVIGLRHYDLGSVDSMNYYNNWTLMRDLPWERVDFILDESPMEDGYLYTIWVISRIFYEPQFLFLLTGLLFVSAIGSLVYHNSDNVVLSMVLYICLGMFTFMLQGLRQSVAIAICLFSVEFVKKRKFIPFLLLVALAACYHRSSMVFALTYFLYGDEFNNTAKLKFLLIAAALVALAPLMTDTANEVMDREYEAEAQSGSALVATATYVIIVGVAYLLLSAKNTDKRISFFVGFTFVGAVMYLLRYTQTQGYDRISFYFIAGQMITLPDVVKVFNTRSRKLLNLLIIGLAVVLFLYRVRTSYATEFRFFWQ